MQLNESADRRLQRMLANSDRLRIALLDDGTGVPLVDCGIAVPGSLEAGLALAEICLADRATVRLEAGMRDLFPGPAIAIRTDDPVGACLAAQYAGWQVTADNYFAMGSGPMRAAAGRESLFEVIGRRERPAMAVGVLESRRLPPLEVRQELARSCDVPPRRLTLLVAPTGSLAGTIQITARSLETGLHKLYELGFDVAQVRSGWGLAPLPPVAVDDLVALGRTNDAILYGAQVQLWVDADDEELAALIDRVPSCASADYGRPFAEIFAASGHDFYQLDPHLFSPAWIGINNLRTGRQFQAGRLAPDIIGHSFTGS